jgi:putative hydrolase
MRQAEIFSEITDFARQNQRPANVDFHMHTSYTDGADSIAGMYGKSCEVGLETILFSEHARYTSTDWFETFASEVRALPKEPCRALVGVEVKVENFDGSLDLHPEIMSQCDLVIASVHRFPGEEGQIMKTNGGFSLAEAEDLEFKLAMGALDNPELDILGHPFGMTVRRFGGGLPWSKMQLLIGKAKETGKAIEINARYHDEPKRLLKECLDAGVLISFGSNAHKLDEVAALHRHSDWNVAQDHA